MDNFKITLGYHALDQMRNRFNVKKCDRTIANELNKCANIGYVTKYKGDHPYRILLKEIGIVAGVAVDE
jgi:hypothetical protein